jgi:iron complex transport system substrate-binding protein
MHRNFSLLILLFIVSLFLVSCNTVTNGDSNNSSQEVIPQDSKKIDYQVNLKYAQGFSVENFESYRRLRVSNPWDSEHDLGVYILVQAGDADGIELQDDEVLIELPLNRVAIMSSSNIGYFDLLDNLDLIKALADENRLYNKALRQGVELGSVKVLGTSAAINLENLLVCNCDIFLQTAYESAPSEDEAIKKAGVNLVYNTDWMEKTPLARAEWIKFIGLLTNENERADSIFKLIEKNYINLKLLADTLSYKPDVLVGALYKDIWYMPAGKSFKARFLADAGTNYHWATDSTEGSLSLSFETVLAEQMNAPVWIEAPFKTKKELMASDERYSYFDAYKIGAVYDNMKRSNSGGGNDYWEMGLCRPDEILLDLIRIFHPEYAPEGELKYYERVAE